MPSVSAEQLIMYGKMRARKAMPYFARAIAALVPVPKKGLGTIAVSKSAILYYDPDTIVKWSPEGMMGAILHEIGHLLRGHHRRRHDRNSELWNIASDCEINDDLQQASIPLPVDAYYPSTFKLPDNLLAEEYFEAIRKLSASRGHKPPGGCGEGSCGGCAGNAKFDEENEPDGKDMGRSESEVDAITRITAAAIRAHEQERQRGNTAAGKVPAGWLVWADAALQPPKIPWEKQLARAIQNAIAYRTGFTDYRYIRPSRRQAGIGYGLGKPMLPVLVSPIPKVFIAVDTSGSMDGLYPRVVSECGAICKIINAPISFVACDAAIAADVKISNAKDVINNLKGGGGTDFRPIFERVLKERPKPTTLVIITDGYGPAPENPPPGISVVWAIINGRCPVKWGTVIEIKED